MPNTWHICLRFGTLGECRTPKTCTDTACAAQYKLLNPATSSNPSPIRFRRFSVSHPAMGSVEVFLTSNDIRHYELCETDTERKNFVAHEAWRNLWNSPAKHMLKDLCDKMGVDPVKKRFTDAITIEEIEV